MWKQNNDLLDDKRVLQNEISMLHLEINANKLDHAVMSDKYDDLQFEMMRDRKMAQDVAVKQSQSIAILQEQVTMYRNDVEIEQKRNDDMMNMYENELAHIGRESHSSTEKPSLEFLPHARRLKSDIQSISNSLKSVKSQFCISIKDQQSQISTLSSIFQNLMLSRDQEIVQHRDKRKALQDEICSLEHQLSEAYQAYRRLKLTIK